MRRLPVELGRPCCRCGDDQRLWDRIARKTYCPNCLELLALGEGDPVIELAEKDRECAACEHVGTIRYLTFPLNSAEPLEMDLCSEHLRAVIGRRLRPYAFELLAGQIQKLGLDVANIFQLHSAYYDLNGRALLPVLPVEDARKPKGKDRPGSS